VIDVLVQEMHQQGFSEKEIFGMRLSLEEAIVNSIKHGHKYDHTKEVTVDYEWDHDEFIVRIEDQGEGFDPDEVPDPLENLEKASGRGLLLMRHYTTRIEYNDMGNVVTLCKHKERQLAYA
jgi:serine/threonine-protein kinase RsbW